jgi:2-polyprenyl-6-methoxyphenol hydroxylase-like FAD-dependent oxidoreductase
MAGLTAARVLADKFDRVVVAERDRLTSEAVPRRGVPQGQHPHTLLASGVNALAELFEGLEAELVAAGASAVDMGTELLIHRFGTVWPPMPIGMRMLSLSRPLLELSVRRRVAARPNVVIRDGVTVTAVRGAAGRVTGATLDTGETVSTDLVVDCTGRGTRSDAWLAGIGCPAPTVAEVKIGVTYASQIVRRTPGDVPAARALFVTPVPPHERRIGIALPIEADRWLVGLGGWHGEAPGPTGADYLSYARSLPYQGIADLLEHAEPLSEVNIQRMPSSRRRLFERLRHQPVGLIAAGDAIASFNPVYGQGMTAAALHALALRRALDRHPVSSPGLARAYHRAVSKVTDTPWSFAVGADFGYPETTGHKPRGTDLLNSYSRRIQLAAIGRADVRRTFVAVQQLLEPPSRLMTPAMLVKALRG